jgi:Methyltransferase domain
MTNASPEDRDLSAEGSGKNRRSGSFSVPRTEDAAADYLTTERIEKGRRRVHHDRVESEIVRDALAALPSGAVVVDVPNGTGRAHGWVERSDLFLVGIDFGINMLRECRRRYGGEERAKLVQGSVLDLPLPDKCADLVLNLRLSHHIPDQATLTKMLKELSRVSRQKVITTFQSTHSLHYLKRKLRGRHQHHCVRSPRAFKAACREAGLRIEKVIHVRRFRQEDVVVICRPA